VPFAPIEPQQIIDEVRMGARSSIYGQHCRSAPDFAPGFGQPKNKTSSSWGRSRLEKMNFLFSPSVEDCPRQKRRKLVADGVCEQKRVAVGSLLPDAIFT
jgi:hypothetical protein